jgi:hypothetical protein
MCDTPVSLNTWLLVAFIQYSFNQGIFNRPWFREWAFSAPRVNVEAETLLGVVEFSRAQQVFVAGQVIFDVTWKCLGLYWAYSAPTCSRTAPGFWYAFVTYLWLALAGGVLTWIGLVSMLRVLDTLQVFHGRQRAAPKGTLEKCELLTFDDRFDGSQLPSACPICIDSFDAANPIRQTPCGHVFHEKCLADWLGRARTCPLCREDLAAARGNDSV